MSVAARACTCRVQIDSLRHRPHRPTALGPAALRPSAPRPSPRCRASVRSFIFIGACRGTLWCFPIAVATFSSAFLMFLSVRLSAIARNRLLGATLLCGLSAEAE